AKAAKAGLALGADAKAKGKDAIALGSAEANGDYTIAIGSASAERRNAIAIGRFTKATHFGSIAIGNSYDEDRAINNNIANSLMVGFNSNQATLFVGPSLGANSSGYVGIGTTRPRAKLDVAGGIKASTANFENLGIGTSRPQAKLHVVGDIKADDIETNYLEATGPSTLKEVYATKIELTGDLQANAVRAYAVVTDGYSSIKNLDTHNGHISHLTGVQSLRALSDDVIDVQASLDINGNVELDGLEAEKLNVSEIKITEGQPSEGKVLTAVDSKGKAEWRDPPASPLNLLPRTSAPSDPKPGDVYIRKRGRDTFMCVYEGRSWTMVNFVYSRYGVYNSYCN
ncbi:MAG: hypothetical protein OXU45_04705, partial [Candidatus Melainabacteria bacterium]|nr:hypothetical protein [Candidatus Melainabacteria bacterium]